MLARSTFLAPGTTNNVLIHITKTATTERAASVTPTRRNCVFANEIDLVHFSHYTQTNCYVDKAIEALRQQCGCQGKFRGKLNPSGEIHTLTSSTMIRRQDRESGSEGVPH